MPEPVLSGPWRTNKGLPGLLQVYSVVCFKKASLHHEIGLAVVQIVRIQVWMCFLRKNLCFNLRQDVLFNSGCHNKISLTRWFKQQKLFSHKSGVWKFKIRVLHGQALVKVSPWLADGHLLALCSHNFSSMYAHEERWISLLSSYKATNPIGLGSHPYDVT